MRVVGNSGDSGPQTPFLIRIKEPVGRLVVGLLRIFKRISNRGSEAAMTKFGHYDTHALLVDRMADTLGADLTEATQRGEGPTEAESRDRVYRCLSCTSPDLCVKFLDAHAEMETSARQAPGYCRNKADLERLALR